MRSRKSIGAEEAGPLYPPCRPAHLSVLIVVSVNAPVHDSITSSSSSCLLLLLLLAATSPCPCITLLLRRLGARSRACSSSSSPLRLHIRCRLGRAARSTARGESERRQVDARWRRACPCRPSRCALLSPGGRRAVDESEDASAGSSERRKQRAQGAASARSSERREQRAQEAARAMVSKEQGARSRAPWGRECD